MGNFFIASEKGWWLVNISRYKMGKMLHHPLSLPTRKFCLFAKDQSRAVTQFKKFSDLCVQNSRDKTILLGRVNLHLLFSRTIPRGQKSGDVCVS